SRSRIRSSHETAGHPPSCASRSSRLACCATSGWRSDLPRPSRLWNPGGDPRPPADNALDIERASERSHTVPQALESRTCALDGTANAVILYFDVKHAPVHVGGEGYGGRPGVFLRVGDGFGDH